MGVFFFSLAVLKQFSLTLLLGGFLNPFSSKCGGKEFILPTVLCFFFSVTCVYF